MDKETEENPSVIKQQDPKAPKRGKKPPEFSIPEPEEPNAGEWRRGKLIASGGFGLVYMAAVTEPRAPRFQDFPPVMSAKTFHGPWRAELENERLLLRRLRGCPHVIRYLGDEETPAEDGTSRLYVFHEFASGGTLCQLIRASGGRLKEGVARRHVRSILAGVKRIHGEGYVHCNLLPHNVWLVEEGGEMVAKVANFAVARRADDERGARGTLAPEGWILDVQGKPSDIWLLGCTVLKMLGGRMQRRALYLMPVLPAGLSREAVDFLGKCFVRKPEGRATVEELMSHPFVCPNKAGKGGRLRRIKRWLIRLCTCAS